MERYWLLWDVRHMGHGSVEKKEDHINQHIDLGDTGTELGR